MSARVLVVDDVEHNVKLLEAKLSTEYFDVVTAKDGMQALEAIERNQPDIVLLDVMMPGMDGFETCRRIKSNPATQHLPVVMVTALTDVADRVRGLESGADDFLTKPLDDQALFSRVKSLVRLKVMSDELRLRLNTGRNFGVTEEERRVADQDITNANILLVESSQLQRRKIEEILAGDAHTTTAVETTADVMRLGHAQDFDLILVNLGLSTDDPLRLCSQIRADDHTRPTPILIIVDAEDKPRLAKALELGVNDYLTKPIDRNELLARVRTQIRRKRYQDRLRADYQRSLSMALTDPLTGFYNRRYLDAHLESLLAQSKEGPNMASVLLFDIDFFKRVNDTYGHAAGDEVLKAVSCDVADFFKRVNDTYGHAAGDEVLKAVSCDVADQLRSSDTLARYGGEEFVVVTPNLEMYKAMAVAERLRTKIEALSVAVDDQSIQVTISIGVATSWPGETPDLLLRRADEALYRAKETGRNRAISHEELAIPANGTAG